MTSGIVLHIVESLNYGGVETHMQIVYQNRSLSSFEPRFCVIAGGGAISEQMIKDGAAVELLNQPSRIPSVPAIFSLIQHIRRVRPLIVHCHGAEANFHGLIAGKLCRVPVCIAEEIGLPYHSPLARMVFRGLYWLANSVVAISESVKRKTIELGEVVADQCQVIPNPTQMLEKRRPPPPSEQFRIGFVGRLEKVKNPLGLVKAVSILREKGLNIALTIVGDGSQRSILEAEVSRLGLLEAVTIAGYDPRPFQLLKEVDLYVQPSLSEGFGLAVVEAMSMGIPVLATAVGGVPEIIHHGENGWLLSGTAPEEIAAGIEGLTAFNTRYLQHIGDNGRGSVVQRFSPAVYILECETLYYRHLQARTQ